MEHRMNKNERGWLIIGVVTAVAVLAALWATSRFWFPSFPFGYRMPPSYEIPGDIEFYYTAQTVVSTVDVALLVLLFFTYASIYRKTRSEFTVGLMIFSAVLFLNALTSNPLVIWAFGFRPVGLGPFALLPDLFTFVALSVLLYLSIKY